MNAYKKKEIFTCWGLTESLIKKTKFADKLYRVCSTNSLIVFQCRLGLG